MLGILGVASGCAGRMEDTVRARAATAFDCPEDQVEVTRGPERFTAEGCGARDDYTVTCSRFGVSCAARSSTEQREYDEARAELQRRDAGR